MNEHILNLLTQRKYGEEIKDEEILRVLFNGENALAVAEAMEGNAIANVGVGRLCKLFGKSRQAYHQKHYHTEEVNTQSILVLDLVAAFRREIQVWEQTSFID